MYEIRPESVKTYLEDRKIAFPRFQRKQTWDDKKNFKLCISVFKNFPVGVVVINREEYKNSVIKYLLDGRQRRNALIKMMEDIENIYFWGSKFIKIKKNDQPEVVIEKFWRAIEEHLEKDVDTTDGMNDNSNEITPDDDDDEVLILQCEEDTIENYDTEIINDDDLNLLLQILLIVHNLDNVGSGFTRPFNFNNSIKNLSYIETINGNIKLSSKKLRLIIVEFNSKIYNDGKDDFQIDDFYSFMIEKFNVNVEERKQLKLDITRNWSLIKERIKIIDQLENKLRDTIIGIIELKNASLIDAQNIFKLINSEGTQLTSEEILSSKPSWNIQVKNPSDSLVTEVAKIYDVLKVKTPNNVVRWDIPATFIGRLNHSNFLIKNLSLEKDNEFKSRLTLGFKLMSAIYEDSITKNSVSNMSKNKEIQWAHGAEDLINNLNLMFKVISEVTFFKFFSTWQFSLMELTSDAVLINFITILYKDWCRKGKPITATSRKFQKNSVILFDRLIYEYITKQWRGSSDSKVANNIKDLNKLPEVFSPISETKWLDLIIEIVDSCKINDNTIKNYKELKPLLVYYYCLNNRPGPNEPNVTITIDHIYSQDIFNSSTIVNKSVMKDNLCNLMLLPKTENSSKNNKPLNMINDPWLENYIVLYSNITKVEFDEFSDLNNFEKLRLKRKELFIESFTQNRNRLLNN